MFITGQHPHLDAGHLQIGYRLGHSVLQLVLDRRHTHQLQVALNLLVDGSQLVLAGVQRQSGLLLALAPRIEELLVDVALGQDERAQTFAGEFLWDNSWI